jgi:hypothetical protein
VLVGTGTAGAYHAGVLRALLEAGVRIDLVAGRGMGAATAMFAAVDASARLWEAHGIWRGRPGPRHLYGWSPRWKTVGASAIAAAGVLLLPLVGLVAAALTYPALLIVSLIAPSWGEPPLARWREALAWLTGPEVLASLVPRLAAAAVLTGAAAVLGSYLAARAREGAHRHSRGAPWWRALGAPLDTARAVDWALDGFWQFMRGAARIARPGADDLSRRYAELLADNLGQPGYRELLLVAHDLDSRRDVVFALLADGFRKRLSQRLPAEGAELVDLAGAGRVHVIDALAAALTPPMAAAPHLVAFAPESFWRGETHRLCDRPGAVVRLLREAAEAGATQAILVSATPPVAAPHGLQRPPAGPRGRIGETLASLDAAACEDASALMPPHFRALYTIRLAHNPVGAFDFVGRADERSDRHVRLAELVERGYEDAYRQFLDPVIGSSGEQIRGATLVGPTPPAGPPGAAAALGAPSEDRPFGATGGS